MNMTFRSYMHESKGREGGGCKPLNPQKSFNYHHLVMGFLDAFTYHVIKKYAINLNIMYLFFI